MSSHNELVRKIMQCEANGIIEASKFVAVDEVIESILSCRGKVIFTGIGKSGLIARKISATMSSIGIASCFIHPSEAVHGDLGMITSNDLVFMLSNSGESDELIQLVSSLKIFSCKLIVLTARSSSTLGKAADIMLLIPELKEADTYSLVPSVSTSIMLALGDAIAITIMQINNFTKDDFLRNHPSGTLGKRLKLKVRDIMKNGCDIPIINYDTNLQEAIFEISQKGLGATLVIDMTNPEVLGIITDGDIRRAVEKQNDPWSISTKDIMCKNPTTIHENAYLIEALELMERKKITILPVVNNELTGIIHLHQIIHVI